MQGRLSKHAGWRLYVLVWEGNGPHVWGVFSSPEAALIHLRGDGLKGWHLDRTPGMLCERWEILDASGGKTWFAVVSRELDRLTR